MFAVIAGTYYWFPKMSGRCYRKSLARWQFWLTLIGFNMIFMVQHFLGLMGMPRRVFTYGDYPGWGILNLISTFGTFLLGVATLLFMWNFVATMRQPCGCRRQSLAWLDTRMGHFLAPTYRQF